MRVPVTAATKYGATGEIAQAIGEVFTERGWDAMVVPPDQVKAVDSFDVVVLGSAVYAGTGSRRQASWWIAPGTPWRPAPVDCSPAAVAITSPKPQEDQR